MNSLTTIRKFYGILGSLIILLIPLIIYFTSNLTELVSSQSYCPVKLLTGFPCPGCGITKSLVFIYSGDLKKSFEFHLFGPFLFLLCIISIIILILEIVLNQEFFNSIIYNRKLAIYLGVLFGGYHIIRLIEFVKNSNIDYILKQSIWR